MAKAISKNGNAEALSVEERIEGLKPNLQAIAKRVNKKLNDAIKGLMWTYYEMGKEIGVVEKDRAVYGDRAVAEISTALGINSSDMYKAITTSQTWNKAQFHRLIRCGVKWSHVRLLVSINDEALRDKMIQGIQDHSWTEKELAAEIQGSLGKRRSGGRTLAQPKTLAGAFKQFHVMSDKFATSSNKVFFGKAFSIAKEVSGLDEDDITGDVKKGVRTTLRDLQKVKESAETGLEALRPVAEEIGISVD